MEACGVSQEMPPAPPEADVIRLARMAARLSPAEAAAAVRDEGGKISDPYWRDVERGHGGRRGLRVVTRASEGMLAQMALAVGVTPEQLTEAGRADAAQVLDTILARQPARRGLPVKKHATPIRREDLPPVLQDINLEALADAIEQVDRDIAAFKPWEDRYEADTWQNRGLTLDGKRVMIAMYRNLRYGGAAGAGRARSG